MTQRWQLSEAIDYLRALIRGAKARGERRLPAAREICRQSGFSHRTIDKAVGMLAGCRECIAVPRVGIFTGDAPVEDALVTARIPVKLPAAISVSGSQRLRDALSQRLLAGAYGAGTRLPTCKQLCVEFGTSHHTLVRALGALVNDGRLVRQGAGYAVAALSLARSASTVVFIAHGQSIPDMTEFTPRSSEFLRQLEKACIRNGLHLDFLSFREAVAWSRRARALLSSHASRPVVGILVWTVGLSEQDLQSLSHHLATLNRPVAVLDEMGTVPLPRQMTASPGFRVFATGYTERCGLDVGTYLVTRGHTAAAFFTVTAGDAVYANRQRGVRTRIQAASPAATTHLIACEPRLDEQEFTRLLEKQPAYCRAVHVLTDLAPDPHLRRQTILGMQTTYMDFVRRKYGARIRSALDLPGVTAWVACNDLLAFVLLGILRERGVAVPGRISVIGFDDIPDAFSLGLTTYNYNVAAIVTAMIDYLVGGPQSRAMGNRGVTEIPGYVVERQSSGAARMG